MHPWTCVSTMFPFFCFLFQGTETELGLIVMFSLYLFPVLQEVVPQSEFYPLFTVFKLAIGILFSVSRGLYFSLCSDSFALDFKLFILDSQAFTMHTLASTMSSKAFFHHRAFDLPMLACAIPSSLPLLSTP